MNDGERPDDEVREALETERSQLRTQLGEIADDDETGFDENFADSGQVAAEQGEARALAASLREQLEDVDRALARLEDGTYGQCETCGRPIGDARLEAMPAARFCIEHAAEPPGPVAGAAHLVKRFFQAVVPVGPSAEDATWAEEQLLDVEVEQWQLMKRSDRRHAAGVARRVQVAMPDAPRAVLAAALLHDLGKVDAGLSTYGRVVATLSAKAVRHDPDVIRDWARTRGFTRRVGLYLQHPKLGGDRLALAGSDPLTVAWTREHHLPEEEWTVPVEVGRVLRDADDD